MQISSRCSFKACFPREVIAYHLRGCPPFSVSHEVSTRPPSSSSCRVRYTSALSEKQCGSSVCNLYRSRAPYKGPSDKNKSKNAEVCLPHFFATKIATLSVKVVICCMLQYTVTYSIGITYYNPINMSSIFIQA